MAAVGTPRVPGVAEALREYRSRAERYFRLRTVEISPGSGGDPASAMREEGEALLARVPDELETFALTREGKGLTSRGLARYLDRLRTHGRPGAAFLVGGAHGLAPEIREGCGHRLSLSPMTLPHGLARLVLVEQIYRAGTILRGEPYHKGA